VTGRQRTVYHDDDDAELGDEQAAPRIEHLYAMIRREYGQEREQLLIDYLAMIEPALLAEVKRLGDQARYYRLAREALSIINDLNVALHPNKTNRGPFLWWHIEGGELVPASDNDRHAINRRYLEEAIFLYLARPWMRHDHIDWCIVDALVRNEWAAFYRSVTGELAGLAREVTAVRWGVHAAKLIGVLVGGLLSAWLVQLAFGLGLHLAGPTSLIVAGSAIIVARSRRKHLRVRASVEKWQTHLLQAMREAYGALDGTVLSPSRVRDNLVAAAGEGAVGHDRSGLSLTRW
jgi:hypothetical protein